MKKIDLRSDPKFQKRVSDLSKNNNAKVIVNPFSVNEKHSGSKLFVYALGLNKSLYVTCWNPHASCLVIDVYTYEVGEQVFKAFTQWLIANGMDDTLLIDVPFSQFNHWKEGVKAAITAYPKAALDKSKVIKIVSNAAPAFDFNNPFFKEK